MYNIVTAIAIETTKSNTARFHFENTSLNVSGVLKIIGEIRNIYTIRLTHVMIICPPLSV